jgi:predicted MFS family arabinose efflux permease
MAILSMAAFASAANIRITDPLLPQVSRDFDVTVGAASVIVTGYTIAYGLLQAFYGPVGDRYGKYLVIVITSLVSAAATLSCAFAPSLTLLAVGRFATATASCAVIPLAMAWVGDVVPYEQRQAVLSRFISGQLAGMIFGQVAGGVLGDLVGWRMVFVVVAAVYTTAALSLALRLRFDPLTREASNPNATLHPLAIFRQFAELMRRPWIRTVLIVVSLEGLLFFGAFAYVGNELHVRFGLGFAAVGGALTGYGVGGLTYTIFARRLLLRLREHGIVRLGGVILAAAFVTLAFVQSLWLMVLAIVAAGFGFYLMHNTLQTHGTQMAPEARGAGVALFASLLFIGQSIGVALAALVIDRWGAAPIFLAVAVLLPILAWYFAAQLRARV